VVTTGFARLTDGAKVEIGSASGAAPPQGARPRGQRGGTRPAGQSGSDGARPNPQQ